MGQSVGNYRRMKTLVALLVIIPIVAGQSRPRVFFDITADGQPMGRIEFELYNDITPRTAENFRQIATGDNPFGYSYKGSKFHRVIPNFMLQGGSQFMEQNLLTKTSTRNIPNLVSSPWLML